MGSILLDKSTKDYASIFYQWKRNQQSLMNQTILAQNKLFKTCAYNYKGSNAHILLLKICWVYNPQQFAGISQQVNDQLKILDPSLYQNLLPWGQTLNLDNKPTNKFIAAGRQFLQFTLQDRLKLQPALRLDQKIFICTQLLIAVFAMHDRNKYHNGIKSSNCLLTSDSRLLLADMAFYKPMYINQQDLASLRIFYNSSMGKNCCLPPQKFSQTTRHQYFQKQNGKKMDIFSTACVILQLFTGKHTFSYQTLCNYRKQSQTYSVPQGLVSQSFKLLLTKAFNKNPQERPSAKQLLTQWLISTGQSQQQIFIWYICGSFRIFDSSTSDCKIGNLANLLLLLQNKYQKYCMKNSLPMQLQLVDLLKMFSLRVDKHVKPDILNQKGLQFCIKTLKEIINTKTQQSGIKNKRQIQAQLQLRSIQQLLDDQKKQKLTQPIKQIYLCIEPPQHNQTIKVLLQKKPQNLNYLCYKMICSCLNNSKKVYDFKIHPFWKSSQAVNYLIRLVNGLIGSCRFINSKLLGIQILGLLGRVCSDQAKLQMVTPILVSYFQSPQQRIVYNAFEQLMSVLVRLQCPFKNKLEAQKGLKFIQKSFKKLVRSKFMLPVIIKKTALILQILGRLYQRSLAFEITSPVYSFFDALLLQLQSPNRQIVQTIFNTMHEIYKCEYLQESKKQDLKKITRILIKKYTEIYLSNQSAFQYHQFILKQTQIQPYLKHNNSLFVYRALGFYLQHPKQLNSQKIQVIASLVVSPNQWIRNRAINLVQIVLQRYPLNQTIPIFFKTFDFPFPIKRNQIDILPNPLNYENIDFNRRKLLKQSSKKAYKVYQKYLQSLPQKGKDQVVEIIQQNFVNTDITRRVQNLLYILGKEGSLQILKIQKIKQQGKYGSRQQKQLKQKLYAQIKNTVGFELSSGLSHQLRLFLIHYLDTCKSNYNNYLINMHHRYRSHKRNFLDSIIQSTYLLNCIDALDVSFIRNLGYQKIITNMPKRTDCHLLTTIYQHRDTVIKLQPIGQSKFVSASLDGSIRLFNCQIYQHQILSDSQQRVFLQGQISDMKVLEGTSSVAACSKNNLKIINLVGKKTVYSQSNNVDICFLSTSLHNQSLSVISLDSASVLTTMDIRVNRPVLKCNLGYRGQPTSLISTKQYQILQSTLSGTLLRYDYRANLVSSAHQYMNANDSIQPILKLFKVDNQIAITFPSCMLYQFQIYDSDLIDSTIQCASHYLSYIKQTKQATCHNNYLTQIDPHRYIGWNTFTLSPRQSVPDLQKRSSIDHLCAFFRDPLRRKVSQVSQQIMRQNQSLLKRINLAKYTKQIPFVISYGDYYLTHFNPKQSQQTKDISFSLLQKRDMKKKQYYNEYIQMLFEQGKYGLFEEFASKYTYSCGCIVDNYIVVGGRDRDHFIKIIK